MIVLFGDSIRMGYQNEVKKQLKGVAEVWAPEENCAHSKNLLAKLDKWLDGKKPDLIHINCGLHDMFLTEGKPRHTIEQYATNLKAIFKKLQEKAPDAIIIFALTTPVNEENQKSSKCYGRLVRRNSDIKDYNRKAVEVAKEFDVQINDLNGFARENGVYELISDDGVHFKPEGCKKLGGQVAKLVKDALASKTKK